MRWSWRIGQIAGIGIYLHGTFLMLLAFIAAMHLLAGQGVVTALIGLMSIGVLFGIVVLHELGHALAARRYGIQTQDITLLPIGGVARLERMPEDPRQEFVVALAGPAVNVVLAAGAFVLIHLLNASHGENPFPLELVGGSFLKKFFYINVVLVAFNLLPAFPMDGGRVLRSLLAMRMDYARATNIAAGIGKKMAFLFGVLGLMYTPILLLTAVFVWMGADAEAEAAQTRSILAGIPVSRAMITDFETLTPHETLTRAVAHILAGFQQDFPVIENGGIVGVLTRADLLKTLARSGQEALVGDAMQRKFETAGPAEMLEAVFHRLEECDCRSLPVVHQGQVVGMVTMDNLGEFMMVQTALKGAGVRS